MCLPRPRLSVRKHTRVEPFNCILKHTGTKPLVHILHVQRNGMCKKVSNTHSQYELDCESLLYSINIDQSSALAPRKGLKIPRCERHERTAAGGS